MIKNDEIILSTIAINKNTMELEGVIYEDALRELGLSERTIRDVINAVMMATAFIKSESAF